MESLGGALGESQGAARDCGGSRGAFRSFGESWGNEGPQVTWGAVGSSRGLWAFTGVAGGWRGAQDCSMQPCGAKRSHLGDCGGPRRVVVISGDFRVPRKVVGCLRGHRLFWRVTVATGGPQGVRRGPQEAAGSLRGPRGATASLRAKRNQIFMTSVAIIGITYQLRYNIRIGLRTQNS
jgi:hypothetical protein